MMVRLIRLGCYLQLATTTCTATPVQAVTIGDVVAAWKLNRQSIGTLHYVVKSERAGAHVTALRRELGQVLDGQNNSEGTADRRTFTFAMSENKIAYEVSKGVWDANLKKSVQQTEPTVFNGRETRTLYQSDGGSIGQIHAGDQPAAGISKNVELIPVWLAHDPLSLLEWMGLSEAVLEIRDRDTYFDGTPCIEVVATHNEASRGSDVTLYVSPDHSHRIIAMRQSSSGAIRREYVLNYQERADFDHVLSNWTSTLFSRGGEPNLRVRGKVIESKINAALDPDVFVLDFPEGTQVVLVPEGSRLPDSKQFRQIDDKGTLQPIQDEAESLPSNDLSHSGNTVIRRIMIFATASSALVFVRICNLETLEMLTVP